jgi:membrane protein DedA with SNARE-associated domain
MGAGEGLSIHKNWHYLFVGSLLTIVTSSLALANGSFHIVDISSYSPTSLSVSLLLAGYLGMFLTVWISPIPDYILIPVYGYLSAIGAFNPYTAFFCDCRGRHPPDRVCGRKVRR